MWNICLTTGPIPESPGAIEQIFFRFPEDVCELRRQFPEKAAEAIQK
jgi:hypothetical protein